MHKSLPFMVSSCLSSWSRCSGLVLLGEMSIMQRYQQLRIRYQMSHSQPIIPVHFVALQQTLNKPYLPVKSWQIQLDPSSSKPEAIGFFQNKKNKGTPSRSENRHLLPMHAKGTSSSIEKTKRKTTE